MAPYHEGAQGHLRRQRAPMPRATKTQMMQSAPAGSRYVGKQHPEAAEQQNAARRHRDARKQSRGHSSKDDNGDDLQGEQAVVDEQPGQLTKDGSQRAHSKASAAGRRARTTAAHPTARNSAANAMIVAPQLDYGGDALACQRRAENRSEHEHARQGPAKQGLRRSTATSAIRSSNAHRLVSTAVPSWNLGWLSSCWKCILFIGTC